MFLYSHPSGDAPKGVRSIPRVAEMEICVNTSCIVMRGAKMGGNGRPDNIN